MTTASIFKHHRFLYVIFFLLFVSCKSTTPPVAQSATPSQPLTEPVLIPDDTTDRIFNGLRKRRSVLKFYQSVGHNPIWFRDGKLSLLADSMIDLLHQVQYYGLPPDRYNPSALENLGPALSADALKQRELLLTDAFLTLSADLKYGVQNAALHAAADSVQIQLLKKVVAGEGLRKSLTSQEPTTPGYQLLMKFLRITLDSAEKNQDAVNQDRFRLISINLERWRGEDQVNVQRAIVINIPSFVLDVIDDDSVVLSSRVIVGKPETETPILTSIVECFTIYPYWHVPRKISVEEYLPLIRADTSFIGRNNFDVLDRKGEILNQDSVPWSKFHKDYFPVTLRQREGPENSLGVIKFIFDNPCAVFLHDTNARRLFKNEERDLSHGCIRMEKAIELAHYLVTGVAGKESRTVEKYLSMEKRQSVDVKNPIPIYTRYFTCEFKGSTFFEYKDIYSKDKILCELLFGGGDKSDP